MTVIEGSERVPRVKTLSKAEGRKKAREAGGPGMEGAGGVGWEWTLANSVKVY